MAGIEFFAFSGNRLGREKQRAESLCFLPSRIAAWHSAQVGLHRSLILCPGTYTIARLAIQYYRLLPGRTNLNKSQRTSPARKVDFLFRDFKDFFIRY